MFFYISALALLGPAALNAVDPETRRTPNDIVLPYPKEACVMDTLKWENGAMAAYRNHLKSSCDSDDSSSDSCSDTSVIFGLDRLPSTTLDVTQRVILELNLYKPNFTSDMFVSTFFQARDSMLDTLYPYKKHWCGEAVSDIRTILNHIYNAWSAHDNKSIPSLVVFTAIAMHNMYSLTKRPVIVKGDKSEKCRGLLQIKSLKYYKMLEERRRIVGDNYNFTSEPENLQNLDACTIAAEYWLFQKEFCRPMECLTNDPLELYLIAVSRMAPSEKDEIDRLLGTFRRCPFHAIAAANTTSSLVVKNRLHIFNHVMMWTYSCNGFWGW